MSNPNYTLEIVSHHPDFVNKNLRKYYVDGIETIGAWGNEPFEIRFKNNTWQKIQVKLSIDGTDILSGATATTEPTKDMWVVNGYGTLNVKAWPETSNGGAQFIFASADKSVAVHTHGDLSSRGIIAAAVYTEGHVEHIKYEPYKFDQHHHHHYYPVRRRSFYDDYYYGGSIIGGMANSGSTTFGGGDTYSSGTITMNNTGNISDCSYNSTDIGEASFGETKSLESLVAVGAGQHVDQKITYVQGLIKPVLIETVRVRFLWWDDLVAKLRTNNVPSPHASGFPADKQNIMSLGNTPRIGHKPSFSRSVEEPVYNRV